MAKTARDVMTPDPQCLGESVTVAEAAKQLSEADVGVIDGDDLVGIVSQADLATNADEQKVGDMVESISAAP